MHKLELAIASNNLPRCTEIAAQLNAQLYIDDRGARGLPFQALLTATTDTVSILESAADVGLYVICRRLIKPGEASHIGLFPLIHHPDRTHEETDAHWRDIHAPLALVHHAHMTHYTQLSVVRTLSGEPYDGFALCGFASEEDLRERFFTTEESVKVIQEDVAKFADVRKSPRRLIATPTHSG